MTVVGGGWWVGGGWRTDEERGGESGAGEVVSVGGRGQAAVRTAPLPVCSAVCSTVYSLCLSPLHVPCALGRYVCPTVSSTVCSAGSVCTYGTIRRLLVPPVLPVPPVPARAVYQQCQQCQQCTGSLAAVSAVPAAVVSVVGLSVECDEYHTTTRRLSDYQAVRQLPDDYQTPRVHPCSLRIPIKKY